jgi:hypothetical protein
MDKNHLSLEINRISLLKIIYLFHFYEGRREAKWTEPAEFPRGWLQKMFRV